MKMGYYLERGCYQIYRRETPIGKPLFGLIPRASCGK